MKTYFLILEKNNNAPPKINATKMYSIYEQFESAKFEFLENYNDDFGIYSVKLESDNQLQMEGFKLVNMQFKFIPLKDFFFVFEIDEKNEPIIKNIESGKLTAYESLEDAKSRHLEIQKVTNKKNKDKKLPPIAIFKTKFQSSCRPIFLIVDLKLQKFTLAEVIEAKKLDRKISVDGEQMPVFPDDDSEESYSTLEEVAPQMQVQVKQQWSFKQTIYDYLKEKHEIDETVANHYANNGNDSYVTVNNKKYSFIEESNKGIIRAINLLRLLNDKNLTPEVEHFILFSILVGSYNFVGEGGLRRKLFDAYRADAANKAQGLELNEYSVYTYFYPSIPKGTKTIKLETDILGNRYLMPMKQKKINIIDEDRKQFLSLAKMLKEDLVKHDFSVEKAIEGIRTICPINSNTLPKPSW